MIKLSFKTMSTFGVALALSVFTLTSCNDTPKDTTPPAENTTPPPPPTTQESSSQTPTIAPGDTPTTQMNVQQKDLQVKPTTGTNP
jgi:hypothetical protein